MRRGGKPGPNSLKILNGVHDKNRINFEEPDVPAGAPDIPPGMGEVATAEWNRVVKILTESGTITTLDRSALMCYCDAFAAYQKNKTLSDKAEWYKNEKTGVMCIAPWVKLRDEADQRMRMWAGELGMTPSSRSRVVSVAPKSTGIKARDRRA